MAKPRPEGASSYLARLEQRITVLERRRKRAPAPPPPTYAIRPAATDFRVGEWIFDSTAGRPLWSNGTAWVDAAGNPV